jgi:hypothetical protein
VPCSNSGREERREDLGEHRRPDDGEEAGIAQPPDELVVRSSRPKKSTASASSNGRSPL